MCNNEYIASFYTSFLCGKHVWLVMPIYEGGSVADIVRARFPKGISNIGIIANILLNVLRALEYLHKQGQIHRDIKCSNIFISMEGKLYLGDFGICGILKEGTALDFVIILYFVKHCKYIKKCFRLHSLLQGRYVGWHLMCYRQSMAMIAELIFGRLV